MNFIKMHGTGNDFVIVNTFQEKCIPVDLHDFARKVCDRRFGIGADGVILILPSEKADLRMQIINSDGSEAEMCGNGIRCFAVLAHECGLVKATKFTVETLAGIITPEIIFNADCSIKGVRVDMGEPRLKPVDIPVKVNEERAVDQMLEVDGRRVNFTAVSMGNPHCVIFSDSIKDAPVTTLGAQIETHPLFPKKVNVEFAQILNPREVNMRVWERGAAETFSCGTGACAVTVASILNNKTERKITVHLLGGDLEIEWADNNHIFMTGPAAKVFTGRLCDAFVNKK